MLNLMIPANDADLLPITDAHLAQWLSTASPGDRIAYHRGHLACDRCDGFSTLSPQRRQELQNLARRAFKAAMEGRAHAMQRRNVTGNFPYFLIARPRKGAPPRSRRAVFASTLTSQELIP